jgi:hypothetical protein
MFGAHSAEFSEALDDEALSSGFLDRAQSFLQAGGAGVAGEPPERAVLEDEQMIARGLFALSE